MSKTDEAGLGLHLPVGARHYRAFVGPPQNFDLVCAMQFNLLTLLGLREHHSLLDIGCGSLRAGKLLIPYLLPDRYFGIEPEEWLVEEGIENEIGRSLVEIKRPTFGNDRNFALSAFGRKFDFLVAQSIFSHASRLQIHRCMEEAAKVMHPQSIFCATFVQGPENYSGTAWVYPGCVTYTLEFLESLVREHGMWMTLLYWPHPYQQTWVAIAYADKTVNKEISSRFRSQENLRACQEKLSKLENHPYVRLGLAVRRRYQQLRGLMRGL